MRRAAWCYATAAVSVSVSVRVSVRVRVRVGGRVGVRRAAWCYDYGRSRTCRRILDLVDGLVLQLRRGDELQRITHVKPTAP